MVCILDDEDYEYFSTKVLYIKRYKNKKSSWYVYCEGYPVHRIVFNRMTHNNSCNYVVDHINRNTCDNRRINLRLLTDYENTHCNRIKRKGDSKYVGVKRYRDGSRWVAHHRGVTIGIYVDVIEAAKAYDLYMVTTFTDPKRINFPEFRLVSAILNKVALM